MNTGEAHPRARTPEKKFSTKELASGIHVHPSRQARGLDTKVGSIMTRNVVFVNDDMSVESLLTLFFERGIRGAPVRDAQNHTLGIVSMTDVLRDWFINGDIEADDKTQRISSTGRRGVRYEFDASYHLSTLASKCVADVMTPTVLSVAESSSVACAAAVMAHDGVHRLLVVADGHPDEVVGIVSANDILAWLARGDGYFVREALSDSAD